MKTLPAMSSDVFYVFEGSETTHAAFAREVARRACALPVCRGDVVALSAGNGPDFVINLFALWKAGAVPFLVSTRVPWAMASDLTEAANARLLITDRLEPIQINQSHPSPCVIAAACERDNSGDLCVAAAPEAPVIGGVHGANDIA